MFKRLVLCLMVGAAALSLSAQTLKVLVMESEPLGYVENGVPKGEHVDYIKAIAERAGVDVDIDVVPKSKLFGAVKSGDLDMAIFFRGAKWDQFVNYVSPIREINVIAVNRVDSPLTSYEGLRDSSRVGVLANTSVNADFDGDESITKYSVTNYETMLKLLTSRRIDTAVGNAIVLSYLMEKNGYTDAVQAKGVTLGKSTQWLQFSKTSSHQDLIPQLQQAVTELQAEGALDDILTSYAGSGWKALNE